MTAETLLHWLQRTSIEASLLILAVLGLRLMFGTRLSPAWRIGLWLLVGMKLMLPAFVPAGFGLGGWLRADETAQALSSARVIVAPAQRHETTSFSTESENPQIGTSESIGGFSEPQDSRRQSVGMLSGNLILLAIWLTGAASLILAALLRQRHFDSILRRRPRATSPCLRALVASLAHKAGVKQPVSIVLMPAGTTPAMVGIRQPKLLLPEDWQTRFDERSLRHVMLHELLHVKQHDLLWNWAATAVQALHWFNPLVWFVVSRFQADRELRCDAGALEILSPSERLDYGHTLLRIQETFFAPPAIAGLAPCVRNHPTLRQRILMIAQPATRHPMTQALLVVTLSGLAAYSFTTAQAAEKEVPPKVREGGSVAKPASEEGAPARKGDGEREAGEKKPGMRDGEGGAKKTGERDGMRKPGDRDGDGARNPGMRDGERPRTGERDGDKPRTGSRDGEGMKKAGERDGEATQKPSAESPRSTKSKESPEKPRKGDGDRSTTSSGELITLKVIDGGDTVLIGDEKVPMNRLRGFLSTFLPDHPGAKVEVTGNDDTPLKALHNTVDAVRDNGNKNVGIKAE
jgi:beta-lactamase regulating signal transducer with metallopeptidase domain